mmetsp:Transcript_785/g.1795  ORF Transcript_785/g.1795 Transcript_785/m.1795 type:complete len:583 (-) Transcript_785:165-1913(-)
MCRPPSIPDALLETESNTQQSNDHDAAVTTTLLVTMTFIGGYGLGVNDTDFRLTCFIGASGLFLFAFLINLHHIRQFFQRISQRTSSFSSISLGRMASKSSNNALSTLSRVTSSDAFKHISSNILSSLDCSKTIRSAIQSITRKECFARSDYIERLSINDLAVLFQYAADANLDTFDAEKFLADNTQTVRSVITAINMAVKVSRGSLSEGTKILSTTERSEGDIDALRFVAVTRIFAEWRNLRMVPDGYKRYAIGLSLGYRDVLQNLEKIERGVHEYLRHHQNINRENNKPHDTTIPSPTLKELLQFEAATKVHKSLPRLKEKSAASGLLWTKRQLHYQTVLFTNTLEVPVFYDSGEAAARAAYHTVYIDYHGWAVKQIFTRSFDGSPPLDKLFLTMNPPTDPPRKRGKDKYSNKNDDFPPPARTLSDINSNTSMSMSERSELRDDDSDNEVLIALDNFRIEIVEKWEDLLRMFNCGKEEKRKEKENLILSSESHFNLNQFNPDMAESSLENDSGDVVLCSTTSGFSSSGVTAAVVTKQRANNQLIQKAKDNAEDFVRGVSPLIADLGVMIDQLNMNDPSKA